MSAAEKIVLGGYYGYNNAGDEIVLSQILKGIRKYFPNAVVYILSRRRKQFSEEFKRINRYNPFTVIFSLFRSDALIMGGGSLIQDKSGKLTIYYYFLLMAAAKILGKKLIIFNQGIGPIDRFFNRLIAGYIFSKSDLVIVRDSFSKTLVSQLSQSSALLGSDPVFDIDRPYIAAEDKDLKIAVALRRWKGFPAENILKDINSGLAERRLGGVFLSLHPEYDKIDPGDCETIKFSLDNNFMETLSGFSGLIGMRLHSLMLGAVAGLPMVGINYDPKVKSFCSYMGIPCFDKDEISVEELLNCLEREISSCPEYRDKIKELKSRLSESWLLLKECIDRGK